MRAGADAVSFPGRQPVPGTAGQPGPGCGPVTKAVLRIGASSTLEVSISHHPGLLAAVKEWVPAPCLTYFIKFSLSSGRETVQQVQLGQ